MGLLSKAPLLTALVCPVKVCLSPLSPDPTNRQYDPNFLRLWLRSTVVFRGRLMEVAGIEPREAVRPGRIDSLFRYH